MVPELDLTDPQLTARRLAVAVGLVLLPLAGLALVAGPVPGTLLVPAVSLVAGAGLTHLWGLPLRIEERAAYGSVIGSLVLSLAVLLLAAGFGLTTVTALGGLGLTLALSVWGWARARGGLGPELAEAARRWLRGEPWPLCLLLAVAWGYTLVLLAGAYRYTGQGLVSGGEAFYADWAAHLTYAGSFAFGANFPPEFPVDPSHPLTYPFLVDLLAAAMVPLGASLTSALVASSGLLALAFPAVMYLAGVRLLGDRAAAALAVLVFTLSGGLGFVHLAGDLGRMGPAALRHLPHLYTQDLTRNYQWLNPVLAWLLPQRSVLFGFSLTLILLAGLWTSVRARAGWPAFAFAGTITGLSPLAHLHGYGTVVALAGLWALIEPRRQWAAFFLPALGLGLPQVAWLLSGGAAQLRWQLWWLADSGGHHDGPLWFWFKNTGLLIPAMLAGFAWRGLLPPGLALRLAPIWLWFVLPNLLVFQPWDWDNTKFFAYWALLGALVVGALLARLFSLGVPAAALAAALVVVLTLAGALDLARSLDASQNSALFTDRAGLETAAWVRTHTDPRSVFLVAPDHNQPIPTLSGRRVVVGYGGWLWTYGLTDWVQRTDDARRMLAGDPATPRLLRHYRVDYVVVGPAELRYGARTAYWDTNARRVHSDGPYTVYWVGDGDG